MMDQTETINGKLYLRAEDGSIVIVEEPFEIEMLTDLPGWLSLNFTSQKKPRILAYQPHKMWSEGIDIYELFILL